MLLDSSEKSIKDPHFKVPHKTIKLNKSRKSCNNVANSSS